MPAIPATATTLAHHLSLGPFFRGWLHGPGKNVSMAREIKQADPGFCRPINAVNSSVSARASNPQPIGYAGHLTLRDWRRSRGFGVLSAGRSSSAQLKEAGLPIPVIPASSLSVLPCSLGDLFSHTGDNPPEALQQTPNTFAQCARADGKRNLFSHRSGGERLRPPANGNKHVPAG